jgi:hypothetical protein
VIKIYDDFLDDDLYDRLGKTSMLQMQIMPAIKLGFAQMNLNDVKTINNYIDTNIQRLPDHSSSLVGQIKQHKKSAQPEFILDDPVPKALSKFFIQIAKEYSDEHPLTPDIKENIGSKEDFKINRMWSVHSYAGDYNPMHEHGTVSGRGVSVIVFLKVPPQIGNREASVIHGKSGATDGLTQFIWDMNSMYDTPRFKHPTYAHVPPVVGKVCVFPIWMHHQVSPFFGDGERRTMSCNIDIINYA